MPYHIWRFSIIIIRVYIGFPNSYSVKSSRQQRIDNLVSVGIRITSYIHRFTLRMRPVARSALILVPIP